MFRSHLRQVSLSAAVAGALLMGALPTAAAPAADSGPRHVADELLVQFRPGATSVQKQQARASVGAARRETVRAGRGGDLELVRLPAGRALAASERTLEHQAAVAFAEPNWIYTHGAFSNDPRYTDGSLWGMYGDATTPANEFGSQAAEAWQGGHVGDDSVYVGVIDEGFQFSHPELDGNTWSNPFDPADGLDNDGNGYVDDVHGWDFANGDNSVYDGGTRGRLDDHGTHVAGTIGAAGGNGIGVVGVNWNVTLISGKFLGRQGGTTANAVKAVDYFTDLKTRHRLNIVATNNSWGGGGFSQALFDAIERASAADILFVAAAGNGDRRGRGIDNDVTPHYPSSYTNANVIAVAAIDSTGAKTTWSNYGHTSVDLGAPGAAIWSTTAFDTYSSYSGTSMATPHVTGAAALYASTNPGADAAAIKLAILSSTITTSSLSGRTVTGGRLDCGGF
jgi:subtilisin family serine protease